jgi:hypothetical protein
MQHACCLNVKNKSNVFIKDFAIYFKRKSSQKLDVGTIGPDAFSLRLA